MTFENEARSARTWHPVKGKQPDLIVRRADFFAKICFEMSKGGMSERRRCRAVTMFPTLKQQTKAKIKTNTMKYALLVHVNKETVEQFKDPSAKAAAAAAGKAYGEALRAAGIFVAGAGLESPQTTTRVSVRDGKRQVHDGPYAETKEYLGGFVIIEVSDLDAALEWAARNPAAADGFVEVRPLGGSYFATRGN